MQTFVRILGWSLLGAVISFMVTYGGCLVYDWALPNLDTNEYREWSQFVILMLSPWPGVITGAIYGIVRARRIRAMR